MSQEDEQEIKENKEENDIDNPKKKRKKDIINELEDKCAQLNEKYLYALAQMKDLHKTYEKENAVAIKYVTYDLMEELLPILDVFTLVLDGQNVKEEVRAYLKGFELVYNQFKQILDRHGVSEIKCNIGDKFDHNIHNGVEKIEVNEGEQEDDTVAQILQKGYKIGDKILRPVSVKVYSVIKAANKDTEQVEQENVATSNEDVLDKGE